ncbi:ferredoxin [Streptomyces sp. NBRC 14336]|uniref:ferredoxin n=1 Tax=Streptomyces sp. NBRC 14336 TaxID=3030992 RepID=UPI0024A4EE19|nr:(4Fe-4S)-binding protein [Streptomyces sp. NBRC 14336]WBO82225.1 (4Fe-4S)-binding protein [Streptomyces sp. SBE_14.2]GLW47206.1 ferredoxin [Streptomyces sp. NBRC 14336]
MRIEADPEVCIGSGMCALTAPDLFDQSEADGTVVVLSPEPPAARVTAVRGAVGRCPSRALSLREN